MSVGTSVDAHSAVFLKAGGIVDIWLAEVDEVITAAAQILTAVVLGTLAEQDGETVPAEFLAVGKGILQLPGQAMVALRTCDGLVRTVVGIEIELLGITVVAPE